MPTSPNCTAMWITNPTSSKYASFQSHQAAGREDRHCALRGRAPRPALHDRGAEEAETAVRQEQAEQGGHQPGHQEDAEAPLNLHIENLHIENLHHEMYTLKIYTSKIYIMKFTQYKFTHLNVHCCVSEIL